MISTGQCDKSASKVSVSSLMTTVCKKCVTCVRNWRNLASLTSLKTCFMSSRKTATSKSWQVASSWSMLSLKLLLKPQAASIDVATILRVAQAIEVAPHTSLQPLSLSQRRSQTFRTTQHRHSSHNLRANRAHPRSTLCPLVRSDRPSLRTINLTSLRCQTSRVAAMAPSSQQQSL